MYLSTLTFTVLALPLLLILYYCIPGKGKNTFLLCAGLLIYGWGSPARVLFPAAYLFFNFGIGMLLQKLLDHRLVCKCILGVSILLQAAAMITERLTAESGEIFLPFGIAVYTLQGISYLIGVYRRKHPAEMNFVNFALYLTFFPLLYAGPLVSYKEFSEQLNRRKCNILNLGAGLELFIRGLAEKVVLADTLGYVFHELRQTDPAGISMVTAWLTVMTFSVYLYFELLGYADMACGLGRCFGIELPKNFGQPFFSASVTNFMESWNITHILWFQTNFRHFLFRNSRHRGAKYVSLILMWMLIGFWYGTSLQFLLWGLCIGLLLVLEQLFLGKLLQRNYALGLLYTAISMQFIWVLFFADSFSEALSMWQAMLGFGSGLADRYGIYFFTSYIVLLLISFYIATDLFRNITERISMTTVGKKITSLLPLIDCVVLLFCLASMLYTSGQGQLWLKL